MSKIQNISIETKKVSIFLDKILIYLDKISITYKYLKKSQFASTISICLDDLDKYLDKDKSRPKNLDFKNLDRDKIKVDLDVMDNLDRFQKLVSTRWTISISIGLERRDPQAYIRYNPYHIALV
jgi:hypothetical protein